MRRKDRPSIIARAALRVRSDAVEITFQDRLAGVCRGAVDDFVIRRSDGTPAWCILGVTQVADDAGQPINLFVNVQDIHAWKRLPPDPPGPATSN